MAKQAKTAIKTKDQKAAADAKNWTKVVKAVRSPPKRSLYFQGSDRAQGQGERFPEREISKAGHNFLYTSYPSGMAFCFYKTTVLLHAGWPLVRLLLLFLYF